MSAAKARSDGGSHPRAHTVNVQLPADAGGHAGALTAPQQQRTRADRHGHTRASPAPSQPAAASGAPTSTPPQPASDAHGRASSAVSQASPAGHVVRAMLALCLALAACRSEPTRVAAGIDSVGAMGDAMGAMNRALAQQQRCASEASEPISLQQAMDSDAAHARAALAQPVLRPSSHEATRVLAELGRRTPRPTLPWKVLVVEGASATFTPLPMGTVVLTRAALRGLRDEAELAALLGYAAVLISHDRLDRSLAQQRQQACRATALGAAAPREAGVPLAFLPADGGVDTSGDTLARALVAQLELTVDPAAQLEALAQVVPLLREAGYAPRALQTVPEHAGALFTRKNPLPAAGEWSASVAEAMQALGKAELAGAVPPLQPALAQAASQP